KVEVVESLVPIFVSVYVIVAWATLDEQIKSSTDETSAEILQRIISLLSPDLPVPVIAGSVLSCKKKCTVTVRVPPLQRALASTHVVRVAVDRTALRLARDQHTRTNAISRCARESLACPHVTNLSPLVLFYTALLAGTTRTSVWAVRSRRSLRHPHA